MNIQLRGFVQNSTNELLMLVQRGDAIAFEKFYYQTRSILRRFVVGRRATAVDDVIQEVFCRVWAQRGRYAGESSAYTYLLGIAVNVLRECRREGESFITFNAGIVQEPKFQAIESCDWDDMAYCVNEARLKLSNRQNIAVRLVYDDELTPREAAIRLGCTEKAMRRRLEEARRKLYIYLGSFAKHR